MIYIIYEKRYDKCQRYAYNNLAPLENLHSISTPRSFHTRDIDIMGSFSQVVQSLKYLMITVEYFTKLIEAEALTVISTSKVQNFIWKNIVCRFRIQRSLISDNRIQFTSNNVQQICEELAIR